MIDDADDDSRALAAMKAIHSKGGDELTRSEAVEFIRRPVYLGAPLRVKKPKRGPHSLDTQYQKYFEMRKGLYQRLVRNPQSSLVGGEANQMTVEPIHQEIKRLAMKLKGSIQIRKMASTIYAILWADESIKRPPDVRTIREILKKISAKR